MTTYSIKKLTNTKQIIGDNMSLDQAIKFLKDQGLTVSYNTLTGVSKNGVIYRIEASHE